MESDTTLLDAKQFNSINKIKELECLSEQNNSDQNHNIYSQFFCGRVKHNLDGYEDELMHDDHSDFESPNNNILEEADIGAHFFSFVDQNNDKSLEEELPIF